MQIFSFKRISQQVHLNKVQAAESRERAWESEEHECHLLLLTLNIKP